MKQRTGSCSDRFLTPVTRCLGVAAAVSLALSAGAAYGQIFVTDPGALFTPTGTIGEYSATGATVNASLVSGLGSPRQLVTYGGNLLVRNALTNIHANGYTNTTETKIAVAYSAPVERRRLMRAPVRGHETP